MLVRIFVDNDTEFLCGEIETCADLPAFLSENFGTRGDANVWEASIFSPVTGGGTKFKCKRTGGELLWADVYDGCPDVLTALRGLAGALHSAFGDKQFWDRSGPAGDILGDCTITNGEMRKILTAMRFLREKQ